MLRFSLTGMMMVHFGFRAFNALAGHQWINAIFLIILTICWVAAWRKREIRMGFLRFIGS